LRSFNQPPGGECEGDAKIIGESEVEHGFLLSDPFRRVGSTGVFAFQISE
jgi:hypothetical protein